MFKAILLALACACAPKIQHGVEAENSNGESSHSAYGFLLLFFPSKELHFLNFHLHQV